MTQPAQHGCPSPAALVPGPGHDFALGYTAIVAADDPVVGRDLEFGVHVLSLGESVERRDARESAWVLLGGKALVTLETDEATVVRGSLFDEPPTLVHVGPGARLRIRAQSERVEWAVAQVANERSFASRIFFPHEVEPEYRGLGLAQGTCVRNVRQVFDRHVRPQSNLVVGEVVNYPGRWSSYPPHHHDQPEVYHYRFSAPQGYGHGEMGEQVYKVRHGDTLRIAAGHDHAQVAAPGYAMYYLWIVRHLDGNPYAGFEYTEGHTWMLDPESPIWEPGDGPLARRQVQPSRRGDGMPR